jgi:hypothetical protein
MALEVARSINEVKQLTTIITARPGTFMGVTLRGSARAFFKYHIIVAPPDASFWLQGMKRQIAEQSRQQAFSGTLESIALNSDTLAQSMERFASLLTEPNDPPRDSAQQRQDDVLHILQRVSSDDQRHLVRLVRRILSHRSLPYRWLLTGEGPLPTFHPLDAMVEGERARYRRNPVVPNLLTLRCEDGTIQMLLCHRILRLLDPEFPTKPDMLISWLLVFGYRRECILLGLNVLHQSGLVEFSDTELLNENQKLPDACLLTDSGLYYLANMFETVDYLTNVVVDVDLEHQCFKQQGDSFVARVESLLEYIEEVRKDEQRQINQILKNSQPGVELLRVAEALSLGGTLLASLTRGLEHVVARGRNSSNERLRKMIPERIEPTIKRLQRTVNNLNSGLRDVANRGRRADWCPGEWERHPSAPNVTRIIVKGKPFGEKVLIAAEIKAPVACFSALFKIEGEVGEQKVEKYALAFSSDKDPTTLRAHVGSFSRALDPDKLSVIFAPLDSSEELTAPIAGPNGERFHARGRRGQAILAVDEDHQGHLDVKLHLVNCPADYTQPIQISGPNIRADELENWCRVTLNELSDIVAQDENFNVSLKTIGVSLANKILSEGGRNALETHLNEIETLVIASRRHSIPWEWLTLPQRSRNEPSPSPLGDTLRTVRFPGDPTLAGISMGLLDFRRPSMPLLTVGINTGAAWHYSQYITNAEDLQQACEHIHTLHLVGDAYDDWIEVSRNLSNNPADVPQNNKTRVHIYDFAAYQLWDTNYLVLSACQIASAEQSHKLAVATSMKSRCIVWVPLVRIDIKHAQVLDNMLGEYLAISRNIEDFMKDRREDCPLLRLYVRYGFGEAHHERPRSYDR